MSAERENFEAWKKNLPKLVDGADEIANESMARAVEQVAWITWQARAEARPSASNPDGGLLPLMDKQCLFELQDLKNNGSDELERARILLRCRERQIRKTEDKVDAQSSRIIELEKELAEAEHDLKAFERGHNERVAELKRSVAFWQAWFYEAEESNCGCNITEDPKLYLVCEYHKSQGRVLAREQVLTLAERAEHAESKLAVCREETVKECIAAIDAVGNVIQYVPQRSKTGIAQRRASSVDFREALLSKLPSVAAEETKIS